MLQLCLLAIADKGNNPTLLGTQAIVTGILVVIIGISLGMNSGYAINPSRDLPPRFFTFLAGWGSQVFRYCVVKPTPGSFLWVPCMWRVEKPWEHPADPPPSTALPPLAAAWEAGMGPDLSPDPAPRLNVSPAPDPQLSPNQAEADQCPRFRANSRARMGVPPLLSTPCHPSPHLGLR